MTHPNEAKRNPLPIRDIMRSKSDVLLHGRRM